MTIQNIIEFGDCREIMRQWKSDGVKVQACVTSPPYFGLRDYGREGQIGLEQTPEQYIAAIVEVFRCVRDLLSDDGTLWLNIGDCFSAGKQLLGIPWRIALSLQADEWILRQDIIWHKPNPMPESVRDRCTKAHEYLFLLSKSNKYFFDSKAMQEPATGRNPGNVTPHKHSNEKFSETKKNLTSIGSRETRNKRSVWTIASSSYKGAHFAVFPPALIEPCILAGSRKGDIILDPFMGSGTTAQVALQHRRRYIGCELNKEYKNLQDERIRKSQLI